MAKKGEKLHVLVVYFYTSSLLHFSSLSPSSLSPSSLSPSSLSPSLFLSLSLPSRTVYSVAPAEVVDPLIYDGFVEELVEVLEIKDNEIMVWSRRPSIAHNTMYCVHIHAQYTCTIHLYNTHVQYMYSTSRVCRYMHAVSLTSILLHFAISTCLCAGH